MFRTQLKIALRTIRKHKGYAFINIAGLTLGLTCALLMLLFITFELSYDRYNANAGRVFRVTSEWTGERAQRSALFSSPVRLEAEFPEVQASARLFTYSWKEKALVSFGDRASFEDRFFLADPAIFDILSFDFLRGDPATALAGPGDVVISRSAAARYFGGENPVGRALTVRNLGQADLRVTAVVEDMPRNSHFHADFLASFKAGEVLFWQGFESRNSSYTYLLLRKGAPAAALERKLAGFPAERMGEAAGGRLSLHLQPLTAIHLRSRLSGEIEANGDVRMVWLFAALAGIILVIAGINFVNLATARSISRAREVGLLKVVGARRGALIRQFMAEAVLFAAIALPIAFALAQVFLPAFNSLLVTDLGFAFHGDVVLYAGMVALTLLLGLASGVYPAFIVSGHVPIEVLSGRFEQGLKGARVRKSLVVLQYAASVVLMIGAVVVFTQMRYIRSRNLGFDKAQVVVIPVKDAETMAGYELLKTAFLRHPEVLSVAGSWGVPSRLRSRHLVRYEGAPGGEEVEVPACFVDFDFLETYRIGLAGGRDFSAAHGTDERQAYLVNEAAARMFGWTEPVGKTIQFSNSGLMRAEFEPGKVVGVVKDFHFRSLREKIEPLVIKIRKVDFTDIAVRLGPGAVRSGLDALAAEWRSVLPGRPFDFSFLDGDIDRLYRADRRLGRVFGYSTVLSILIAGLGLFGLASLSAARRTREVGIRKVLGASACNLTLLLSREFARLVLLGNLIAWPLAYLVMRRWLDGYAYRTGLSPWVFAFASGVSFLVALGAVSLQAVRSSLANPARSLRHE